TTLFRSRAIPSDSDMHGAYRVADAVGPPIGTAGRLLVVAPNSLRRLADRAAHPETSAGHVRLRFRAVLRNHRDIHHHTAAARTAPPRQSGPTEVLRATDAGSGAEDRRPGRPRRRVRDGGGGSGALPGDVHRLLEQARRALPRDQGRLVPHW